MLVVVGTFLRTLYSRGPKDGAMQGRDVFISHVEEDAGVALAMATALRSLDVSGWT